MKNVASIRRLLYWLCFAAALGLLGFLCLYHLEVMPLQNWDESRHAVSAYEMMKQHEGIVTTYGYEPDYWNLKPPMSEYFIMLGYRICGFNIRSIRLYAAISMILTGLLCGLFAEKRIGKYLGIVPILILASMSSILFSHGARNGDADMLYVLFFTCCVLCLIRSHENVRFLYASGLFFALAFLTKSWHAGMLIVIMLCDVFLWRVWANRKRSNIEGKYRLEPLTLRQVVTTVLCGAVPILVWAVARFAHDGMKFLIAMFSNDVAARATEGLEGHNEAITYYIDHLLSDRGVIVSLMLTAFAIWGMTAMRTRSAAAEASIGKAEAKSAGANREEADYRDKGGKDVEAYRSIVTLLLAAGLTLCLYSLASTKLTWYVYPAYPVLTLLGTYGVHTILTSDRKLLGKAAVLAIPALVLMVSVSQNLSDERHFEPAPNTVDEAAFNLLTREADLAGKRIYIDVVLDTDEDWEQRDFLAMELAGDMQPVSGEREAFDQDPEGYLFCNMYTYVPTEGDEIVAQTENGLYMIVAHVR